MKKISPALLLLMVLVLMLSALTAYGEQAKLKSVEFKNATVEGEFSPDKYDYTLNLINTKVTPTLKNYKLSGDANVFVSYSYDSSNHQDGVIVTLEYKNGSVFYTFKYKNAEVYEKSDNNFLREAGCNLGVVYPEINHDTNDYKLYIPSDLTVLDLFAATEDIGAYCKMPNEITLSEGQELSVPLVVVASNGESRTYTFDVLRTDKTSEEFTALIKSGNTAELVKSERFYQKPAFLISMLAAAGGILIIWLLVRIASRLTIEANDSDEKEFYDTI